MRDVVTAGPGLVRFRPTWRQAVGRGLWLGTLGGAAVSGATALVVGSAALLRDGLPGTAPTATGWLLLVAGPPVLGVLVCLVVGRRYGTDADLVGLRPVPGIGDEPEPWTQVVDLRAERRRGRRVVSVYLRSGDVLRLRAPYDGELLAADPEFERKLFALSHLWEAHRTGGGVGRDPA